MIATLYRVCVHVDRLRISIMKFLLGCFVSEMVVDEDNYQLELTVGSVVVEGHLWEIDDKRHRTFKLLDHIEKVPASETWNTTPYISFPKSMVIKCDDVDISHGLTELEASSNQYRRDKNLFQLDDKTHKHISSVIFDDGFDYGY